MPEFLTDEQAALIWSGSSASLAPTETEEKTESKAEPEVKEEKDPIVVKDKELDNLFAPKGEEDEEEEDDEDEVVEEGEKKEKPKVDPAQTEKKTPGRKTTDLISIVSQLIEEDVLKPFEDGEVKTIEDARDLIKLNLQSKEEEAGEGWWKSKVESYSPQVQIILDYAERGGTNITPLLNAISQVEDSATLSIDTAQHQEEVVRQVLKIKGFDEEEIEDQVSTLKDLDKLKSKAEKFLPELQSMKQQNLQRIMQAEEKRRIEAEEATRTYLNTVQSTLGKENVHGIKLQREDKAKIYEALASANYRSLSGEQTNGFVKALEEMQFGRTADYEHFLNVVHLTVDREGFMNKVKESLKNEVNAEVVKKLKTAKTSNSTAEEIHQSRDIKKNTVSRSTFKNPFA